jgi:hypothetical protein
MSQSKIQGKKGKILRLDVSVHVGSHSKEQANPLPSTKRKEARFRKKI